MSLIYCLQESVPFGKPITFIGKYISRSISKKLQLRRISKKDDAKWIKDEIINLGPAYIKMGQLVASRSDIFDEIYTNELISLQDNVNPIDFSLLNDVLITEYENRHNKIFDYVDINPIACASIGQVHLAKLHYNQNTVALKIQKPEVKSSFEKDFNVMLSVLNVFNIFYPNSRNINDLYEMIKQCSISILSELDYRNEKQNMDTMRRTFKMDSHIYVPKVYNALTTEKVLVMEYVKCEPLNRLRGSNISNLLMKSMIINSINYGYLHGDMHKGNFGIINNEYDYTFVIFDCGLILDIEKNIMTQLLYAISINSIDVFINVLVKYNVIIIKDDYESSIKELKLLVGFLLEYINNLDIKQLVTNVQNNLNLESNNYTLNSKYFLISRTLTLLEGTCKGIDDGFSYKDVMMKALIELDITPDMLLGKISFDMEQMKNRNANISNESIKSFTDDTRNVKIPTALNLATILLLLIEILS